MVNKLASLVLNLSDSFTKKPISSLASVSITLDGEAYRPIYKDGGWFVFVNLPRGEHLVTASSSKYQTERIAFTLQPGSTDYVEEYRRMKPSGKLSKSGAQGYSMMVVIGGKPYANASLLLLMDQKAAFKVAEDDATRGRNYIKLFTASPQTALQLVPGHFFIHDGTRSEICAVRERGEEDVYALAGPLANPHKRGVALRAVEEYWTDEKGMAFLIVPEGMEPVFLCAPQKTYKQYTPVKTQEGHYTLDLGQ